MFRMGSTHTAVRTLKTFLNGSRKTAISNLKINSLFDIQTQTALTDFQKKKGLMATGIMNFKTWQTIGAEMHPTHIEIISAHDSTLRSFLIQLEVYNCLWD